MTILMRDFALLRIWGRLAPEIILLSFSVWNTFTGKMCIRDRIIAASVRNPIHVIDCALAGADIATVPYSVIEQMTKHPLTDQGIAKFQADYKAVFGE